MNIRTVAILSTAAIALAGCGATTQDRSSEAGGAEADNTDDTYDVTVWRNIDDAPNVIVFCVDGLKVMSTRTRAEGGADLEIMPDEYQDCAR